MKSFRYQSVFMYGSLQSVGHVMEYFILHTKRLVIFIMMPRQNNMENILRVYERGELVHEKHVRSSSNIIWYYLFWWWHHTWLLLTKFPLHENVLVFSGHPVAFFGMRVMRLIRSVTYAYWIGDYFPPVHWSLVLFEKLKKYYHDRIPYTYYLGDRINTIYNGRAVNETNKRTVMWGMTIPKTINPVPKNSFSLLFIGVIRPSQGIEELLEFVHSTSHVSVSILGSCEAILFSKYQHLIHRYGIKKRVWFPNRFFDDTELHAIAKRHHVGIALYEKGEHTATYYTDPGKIKTYIELGLPVVMTDTSEIVPFVKRFYAGEVITDTKELPKALFHIQSSYDIYINGLRNFAQFFEYEQYYHKAFRAFEAI